MSQNEWKNKNKENIVKKSLLLGLLSVCLTAGAADYDLVKDGKTASCIVLPDNAGPVEKHAASELSSFLP